MKPRKKIAFRQWTNAANYLLHNLTRGGYTTMFNVKLSFSLQSSLSDLFYLQESHSISDDVNL